MKRVIALFLAFLMMAFFVTLDYTPAEKPTGSAMSQTYAWTFQLDSTDLNPRDTQSTIASGSSKIMRFDDAKHYANIKGFLKVEYTHLDTGSAAADVMDTTKDSVIVQIMTSNADFSFDSLIWTTTITALHFDTVSTSADYIGFDLSDSVTFSNLWVRFISAVQDSDYDISAVAGGVDFRGTVQLYAK